MSATRKNNLEVLGFFKNCIDLSRDSSLVLGACIANGRECEEEFKAFAKVYDLCSNGTDAIIKAVEEAEEDNDNTPKPKF